MKQAATPLDNQGYELLDKADKAHLRPSGMITKSGNSTWIQILTNGLAQWKFSWYLLNVNTTQFFLKALSKPFLAFSKWTAYVLL
ncbi:hypothetical protein X975_13515, partial [Stegodyphus mimosarum]